MLRSSAFRVLQRNEYYFGKRTSTQVHLPEQWNNAKPYESIPGPIPLPIVGNAWRFFGGIDFVKLSTQMHNKYGDVVLIRKLLGFGDMVFLHNIRDIEWLLRNEGPWPIRANFLSLTYYRHVLRKDIFGDTYGLINGQSEHWGVFRTAVNPIMMQPRVTHQYIKPINEITDEFIEHVKNLKEKHSDGELPANFIDELNKWSFESINAIALDKRWGCLKDKPNEAARKAIVNILLSFELIYKVDFLATGRYHRQFNTRTWKRFVKCQDYFTNMTLELIEQAEQRIKSNFNYENKPEDEKSVFDKLVAKDKTIAMVMILDMLAAGVDTTAKMAGAVLYFLAKSPEIQNKLRAELKYFLPTKNTPLTKDILEQAKYLRACIKEALRIAPIAFGNIRTTTKPMVMGGYQFPAGVIIAMPHLYLSFGSDEHFKNPKEYNPDRWLRDVKTDNLNAFVSLPFGFGPRSCIGKRMANMEIEILIAKMVRNFVLDWRHNDMKFKQEFIYGFADPLKIRLTQVTD